MVCACYGIYTRSGPKCIFHYQLKILYNLFSPDPAVYCVGDKPVSHCEIYTL